MLNGLPNISTAELLIEDIIPHAGFRRQLVAIRGNVGALVQAKTSANDSRALNWDAVKEVIAGEAFYQRRHPGIAFAKVGLTNQRFNAQAQENAALNQVRLLEQTDLAQLLQQYPVTMLEVERLLFAQPSDS